MRVCDELHVLSNPHQQGVWFMYAQQQGVWFTFLDGLSAIDTSFAAGRRGLEVDAY